MDFYFCEVRKQELDFFDKVNDEIARAFRYLKQKIDYHKDRAITLKDKQIIEKHEVCYSMLVYNVNEIMNHKNDCFDYSEYKKIVYNNIDKIFLKKIKSKDCEIMDFIDNYNLIFDLADLLFTEICNKNFNEIHRRRCTNLFLLNKCLRNNKDVINTVLNLSKEDIDILEYVNMCYYDKFDKMLDESKKNIIKTYDFWVDTFLDGCDMITALNKIFIKEELKIKEELRIEQFFYEYFHLNDETHRYIDNSRGGELKRIVDRYNI